MRIVIDTNVFVSSFYGGNPLKVISLWLNGSVVLCVSKAILTEYSEVLARMVRHRERVLEILHIFDRGTNVAFIATTPEIRIVTDPDDDKFIECAVALKAEIIVTGDAALLKVGKYAGITIMKPADFLIRI